MSTTKRFSSLLLTVCCLGVFCLMATDATAKDNAKPKGSATKKGSTTKKKPIKLKSAKLKSAKLGITRNVHTFGKTILCGQPTAEDFVEAKKRGIKVVLTVRMPGEVDWDEKSAAEKSGLKFHSIPFGSIESLDDKVFEKTLKLLANQKKEPVLFHCGSANRVGAIWATHRVLNDGLTVEKAFKEAKEVGLRNMGYAKKAQAYIRKQQAIKKAEKAKKEQEKKQNNGGAIG